MVIRRNKPNRSFLGNGKKQLTAQEIKSRARRNLNKKVQKEKKNYVVDTSVIINKFIPRLLERGLKGKIIVPNAAVAELENLANKGNEAGFIGLDQVAYLHKLKKKYKFSISFEGIRPEIKHIKYAKSGEIDALIRGIAFRHKAILITADLVQAKSAQAYGLEVIFLRPKVIQEKKSWLSFLKRRKKN